MPLAQPLALVRQNLEAQIRENQLPEALNALLALLPEGSETYRIVSALIARLNAANKERYRDTISMEEYSRLVSQVRADFFDLTSGLTEDDFEAKPASAKATAGKAGKVGSVLYRVPQVMTIPKPVRCTIRVAVDEDAILENIVLDEHVQMKSRVEISDVMRAELVDAEGGVFQITALNAPNQLVRETGYTEWNFSVTPLREGVHQLLVKVSIMEIVPGHAEPILRDVSVMETVTIVTEGLPADLSADLSAEALAKVEASAKSGSAPSETPSSEFKPSGQSFAFQSTATAQGLYEISYSKSVDAPSSPPITSPPVTSTKSANRGLRALALFLAFIILAPAATWAVSPKLDRELFLATLQTKFSGSAAPLDEFIKDHQQDPAARPYLDKAYFRKAENTDSLSDLRVYQQKFGEDGKYRLAVLEKIGIHENKAVRSILDQPNALNIRQFVAKFPESERLPEIKQAVENRMELRTELLADLENAYITSTQLQPTETKVAAYLRDFPKHERLNEIAQAAAARPEVLAKARMGIEDAITRKVEAATTADQVRQILPALESAGSSAAAAKIEKLVEGKPNIRQQVRQQVRQTSERVREREKSGADLKLPADSSPMSEAERLDWEAALQANTARAFVDFVNKYPKTSQFPEARAKIYALRPALSPEEQAWADATLANRPEAFIYFVQKYPAGGRNVEARARIKTFSLSIKERKRLEALAAEALAAEASAAEALAKEAKAKEAERQREKSGGDSKSPPDSPNRNRRSGLEMIPVAGGSFTMGSPESEEGRSDDECQHKVSVKSFSMGKYEVTQADWFDIMGTKPSKFKDCDECPVEQVSWDDIQDFLKALNKKYPGKNYRLPTEAEWEYAARGGNKGGGYKYAGSNDLKKVAWYDDNSGSKTHRVGELKANELGIFDMSGNVWEWCQDKYGPYPGCSGTVSSRRVNRGGSWFGDALFARAARRSGNAPEIRFSRIGFRLASSPQ